MRNVRQDISESLLSVVCCLFIGGVVLICIPTPGRAGPVLKPLHIATHLRGGDVSDRVREIRKIIATGARVRLDGAQCLSSCTMYLGVPDVCVGRDTHFGFHGPSNARHPLTLRQFNYWSRVIADHYPKALAKWYMRTGRHITHGYYYLTGAQLIRLGIKSC